MPWVEKRRGQLLLGWRDPVSGKKVRRSVERLVAELPSTGASVRLGTYLSHVLSGAQNLRESTRYAYSLSTAKHINPVLGKRALADITAEDLRHFFDQLTEAGLGPSARAQVRRILSRTYRAAMQEGLVTRNPVTAIPEPQTSPRVLRLVSTDQVEALASAVTPRYRTPILLGAYGGLRIGEVGALTVDNVDLGRAHVKVVKSVASAGGRQWIDEPKTTAGRRGIPLPRSVALELGRHIETWGLAADGRIFSTPRDGLLHHGSIAKPMRQAVQRARLLGVTFHDLRHHYAALLVNAGAHPKLIQSLLGHSSIKVTLDLYGHLLPGMSDQIAARLEARRGKVASTAER